MLKHFIEDSFVIIPESFKTIGIIVCMFVELLNQSSHHKLHI